MKKILQIGMTSNYGGIESFIMNLYRHIDRSKFQFDFVNMETDGKSLAYSKEIKSLGGHIYKIPGRKENLLANRRGLTDIVENGHYDFVHNNILTWSYSEGISIPLKKSKSKVIVHSHNSQMNQQLILRRILNTVNRRYNNKSNLIRLACSQEAGHWLFRNKPFKVIPNGIDTIKYKFDANIRDKYRRDFKVEDSKVFLHVGRLSHQKNHAYLFKLFQQVLKLDPNCYLFLVGDGELKGTLKQQVKEMGLESKIIFLGIRHDVSALMQMSDCFLFPSFYEGLGIVLIEAQATGLPCLVSDKIPSIAILAKYTKIMNISNNSELYASEALKMARSNISRLSSFYDIQKAGYDVAHTARLMEKLYSK